MSRHSEITVGATFPEDFRKKFLELVGEFDDTMLPEQTPSIEFDWNGKGEALITYRKMVVVDAAKAKEWIDGALAHVSEPGGTRAVTNSVSPFEKRIDNPLCPDRKELAAFNSKLSPGFTTKGSSLPESHGRANGLTFPE